MKFSEIQKQIIDLIKRSNKILILPSSPIDGDSIGSALSIYTILKKLGKEVTVASSERIPDLLNFLPKTQVINPSLVSSKDFIITLDTRKIQVQEINTEAGENKLNIVITPKEGRISESDISFNEGQEEYELIITVDTADLKQLRKIYEDNMDMFHEVPVINIDHHISNEHYGKVNYVDIMSASTTELLLPLFEQMEEIFEEELIDEDVATLLLTGIITDTGSFQNSNTTPKAFAHAAQLIAYGARQQEIIQHIYKTKQLSQLKLWGRVLSKIQTDDKYKIVWSSVTQQDFKDTKSKEEETADIIDELMTNAPGAEVVLLLKEKSNGTISGSIRTTSTEVDASNIAEMFGGGGHSRAAGFVIKDGEFRKHEDEIMNKVRNYQKERLNIIESQEDDEEKPMIDVKKLLAQVKEAEKAVGSMPKPEEVEKFKKTEEESNLNLKVPKHESEYQTEDTKREEPKKEEPSHEQIFKYRFED